MAVSLIIFEIEQDIGQRTPMFDIYTVFQKKTCDHIFDDKLN